MDDMGGRSDVERPTGESSVATTLREDMAPGSEPSSVLILTSGDAGTVHGRLLEAAEPEGLVGVAIRHDPTRFRRFADRWLSSPPERFGVVDVGGDRREAKDVRAVGEPSDLTGIGMAITRPIGRWEVPSTVVAFDSLTPVLQYTERERWYRFLDLTTGQISRSGAVVHATLNPDAHDQQAVESVVGVFDAVVEPADRTAE